MRAAVRIILLTVALGSAPKVVLAAQVLRAAELTAPEFRALDRQRTALILPGGILEEHGPYLPAYTDGYLNLQLADSLAAAIARRPGWTAVVFPAVPLGNSGANDIGAKYTFPGTVAVRFETLRAVYMDLADELGRQGFRWLFVVHLHGAPNHSRALDHAGDYFGDQYRGKMIHLAGLMPIFGTIEGQKDAAAKRADGLPIHSGMDETSWLLALQPGLVRAGYRTAPDQADSTMEGLVRLARLPDWPGYFGAPRLANVLHGQAVWNALRDSTIAVAGRILDGANPADIERFATVMLQSPADVRLDAASRREEARRAARQRAWLQRHRY
ncbi:MAG: creatininase family protein [Gemmatimonadales bacterium]